MASLLTALRAGAYPELSAYFSLLFLGIFLPACLVLYSLTPGKYRKYALLLESLLFYWLISGAYILYLLASVGAIFAFGLWMQRIYVRRDAAVKTAEKAERKAIKKAYQKKARHVMTLGVLLHIGLILVLKYTGFFLENVNALFGLTVAIPAFVKPLGLSFFILQSVSYLVDVYRQTIPADGNVLRLGLYLSFFPGIVEGPICRYGDTARALWEAKPIAYENLCLGLQRIAFGLMKKLVIADRLNPMVEELFSRNDAYPGYMSLVGGVLYTLQLYADFSGSMDAVCGTAQIFGLTVPENFRRPFFSKNISEFWTRWHITLGTWFRDYIFYPVTMSAPLKKLTTAARKKLGNHFGPLIAGSIALLCVWFCNGLWHGAAWHYVFFGLYHFVLILLGSAFAPLFKRVNSALHLTPENKAFRLFQMLRTTFLVILGEIIFRADNMAMAGNMLRRIFTDFGEPFSKYYSIRGWMKTLADSTLCSVRDLQIVGVAAVILLAVSILQERGGDIRSRLSARPAWQRWAVWYALLLFILIFGAYGPGYVAIDPMYANF